MSPLRRWTEKSVWSLVCAMELGLIPDPASSGALLVGRAVLPADASAPNGNRIGTIAPPKRRPRRGLAGRRRRRRASGSALPRKAAAATLPSPAPRDSTVDEFWKSCKRKLAGSWKRASVESPDEESSSSREESASSREESASGASSSLSPSPSPPPPPPPPPPPRSPAAKRRRDRDEDPPAYPERDTATEFEEREIAGPDRSRDEERAETPKPEADETPKRTPKPKTDETPKRTPPETDRVPELEDVDAIPLARRISSESPGSSGEDESSGSSKSVEAAKSEKPARPKISRWADSAYPVARRVTRRSAKIGRDNFIGKLVWGFCSGWWPAMIVDADHVGMLTEPGKMWVYWIGEARISLLSERNHIEPFSSNLQTRLTQNLTPARTRAIDATMQMLRTALGCPLTKPYSAWIENNFSDASVPVDEAKFYPYPGRIQRTLTRLKGGNERITKKYLQERAREALARKAHAEKPKDRVQLDPTRLTLGEQNPGVIAWAKLAGHNWWPAMILDYRDCCMSEPNFGCQWIMWYGDHKLSQVHHQWFMIFDKGLEKMRDYIEHTKKHAYRTGVLQAAKDYLGRVAVETEGWLLEDVLEYFARTPVPPPPVYEPTKTEAGLSRIFDKYSPHIVEQLHEMKMNAEVDDKRVNRIEESAALRSALNGERRLDSVCLVCLTVARGRAEVHPYFEGALCEPCSEQYKPRMFVFGTDAKCFYCAVCGDTGTMIICDREDCPRVFCMACTKHMVCPRIFDRMIEEDPWECFVCRSGTSVFADVDVRPRADWKERTKDMFRTGCNPNGRRPGPGRTHRRRKIRVLSLFDGLGTGLLVLQKLGIDVDVYYASEIDPDALMVSRTHFGDRIHHLGDVRRITKATIKKIAPIDLLIGGSPCNDLSLANPARLGLYDPKGTGILFFEYQRILKQLKKVNNRHRLFWLYENVASMPTEYRLAINGHLGREPDAIDSADFSPQHRLRLYWHNLPIEPHSLPLEGEQDVQDVLTPNCQRYALVKKIRTVTTKVNSLKQGKLAQKPIVMKDQSDTLWITELEEVFGFPRHYTDVKNLSATKRQRLIGKSWSVQTLTAILRSLCPFFERDDSEVAA